MTRAIAPTEMPDEYEARLRPYLERERTLLQDSKYDTMTPGDSVIPDELIQTYTRERYGGREPKDDERAHLHVGSNTPASSASWPRSPSNGYIISRLTQCIRRI